MPSHPTPAETSTMSKRANDVPDSPDEPLSSAPLLSAPLSSDAVGIGHGEAMVGSGLVRPEDREPSVPPPAPPFEINLSVDDLDLEGFDLDPLNGDPIVFQPQGSGDSAIDAVLGGTIVREFDMNAGIESLDASHIEGENESANEDDFAVVGVRNLEWRLSVIRVAAHRSAETIASSYLDEPSWEIEEHLTRIVLSTYRLIDPRYRDSYFQRVRVGRLMPMLLQKAACLDFTPTPPTPVRRSSLGTAVGDKNIGTPEAGQESTGNEPDVNSVRLFGHTIPLHPIAVTDPPDRTNFRSEISLANPTGDELRTRHRDTPSPGSGRAEALEVLAEFRAGAAKAKGRQWIIGTRLVIVAGCVIAMFGIGYGISGFRQARSPNPVPGILSGAVSESLTARSPNSPGEVLPSPKLAGETIEEVVSNDLASTSDPAAADNDLSGTTNLEFAESSTQSMPETVKLSQIDSAAGDGAESIMTPDELIDALADPIEIPNPMTAKLEATSPTFPSITEPAEMPATEKPDTGKPAELAPEEIDARASELWAETDSAARRFTLPSVAELIDEWELMAELFGSKSIERAAANRLILHASWLDRPFSEIVSTLRSNTVKNRSTMNAPLENPDELSNPDELTNTSNLDADEIDRLIESWQSARGRVVHAVDVNAMLFQSSVFLDAIVISVRLTAPQRVDRIEILRDEIERLVKISSDADTIADSDALRESIAALPEASEWARLERDKTPSGMLASVYCLHQRRWSEGIEWLSQTSNPSVAGAAKTEWQWRQSEGKIAGDNADGNADKIAEDTDDDAADIADQRIALAVRWSKIAERLKPREAASVRLHAIELFKLSPDHENERRELTDLLPRYLRPRLE